MIKILIPTDFSDTAKNAFSYAKDMALALGGAELTIVHVFMPAVESEYPNFVPPIDEFMRIREKMLVDYLEEIKKECGGNLPANIRLQKELLVGFAVEELSAISEAYDYIVMGTTGESGIFGKIFGSISSGSALKAKCPVLLVPDGLGFSIPKHILYASNYESADEDMVEKLVAFNKTFKAHVHFVHVSCETDEKYKKSKEEIFEELFQDGESAFAFEMAEVDCDSILEGLNEYAQSKPVDMLVMVNRKRSFWGNFFHKSLTKKMAMITKMPLMVFHL